MRSAVSPWTGPRSGSCDRPAGRCPSTGRSAATATSSRRSAIPRKRRLITLQPLARMPLDAAVVFGDIVTPLAAVGVPVRVEPGRGPVAGRPDPDGAPTSHGCGRSSPRWTSRTSAETVRLVAKETDVPVIGFAGAPFTLASYLVEGGPSRDHARTKALMLGDPGVWDALMRALVGDRGAAPARAGRGGCERGAALRLLGRRARPARLPAPRAAAHRGAVFEERRGPGGAVDPLRGGDRGAAGRHGATAGGDAIGVDHRVPLDVAWERIGGPATRAIQGNLDPAVLLAPWEARRGGGARRPRARAAAATATSSTWATGSCPTRRWPRSNGWWTWCTSGARGDATDRRARDGLRHRRRPRRHRALLHGHPRRPSTRRPSTCRSCATATPRSATSSRCSTRRRRRPRGWWRRLERRRGGPVPRLPRDEAFGAVHPGRGRADARRRHRARDRRS